MEGGDNQVTTFDFFCFKCKEIVERVCSSKEIGNQKCEKCGKLLVRYYGTVPEIKIPAWWSGHGKNDPDIIKPRTDLQRQRQREFYENSEPYR